MGNALKRFRETGQNSRKELRSKKNHSITGNEIRNFNRQVRNVSISKRTVRRKLNECNLRALYPAHAPLLYTAHKMSKLSLAKDHFN